MASSVIGALRVNLGLDSAQFQKGAGRVRRHVEGIRQDFMGMARVAGAAGAALAALGATAIRSAREIERLSQVSNASPEQFQRMAAGAETVGIQQEKLADIMKDMNDRVGDFLTTGGGPMADFFEQIAPKVGVTADQFARLSGPDALQLFVSSLEKANLSQQEMTFYMEAIAGDFTLLLPLLRDNGAEMGRLGDRAAALGAIMDGETVAALSRTRTAFGEIMTAMTGARNIVAAEFAPALERMSTALAESLMPGGQLRSVLEAIGNWSGVALRAIGSLTVALGVRYVAALGLAAAATGTLSGALVLLRGALLRSGLGAGVVLAGELVYRLSDLRDALGLTSDKAYDAEAGTAALNAALGTFHSTAAPQAAASAIDIANANIKLAESAFRAAEAEVARRRAFLDEMTGSRGRNARGRETELNAAIADLDKAQAAIDKARADQKRAFDSVAGTMSEIMVRDTEAARELTIEVNETSAAVGGLGGKIDTIDPAEPFNEGAAAADQFGSSAVDALADVLMKTQSLSEAARGLANQFLRMALNTSLSGVQTALGNTSLGESVVSALGPVFGGTRVNGGRVSAGMAYLAGERRPELFVPDTSGTIMPDLGGIGSGDVEITINNYSGQPVETQRGPNGRIDVTIGKQMAAALRGDPDVRRAMAQGYGLTGAG